MSAIDHINKTIKNLRDSIHQLEDLKKDMLKSEENSSAEYTSAETSAEATRSMPEYKTSWASSAEYFSSEF